LRAGIAGRSAAAPALSAGILKCSAVQLGEKTPHASFDELGKSIKKTAVEAVQRFKNKLDAEFL